MVGAIPDGEVSKIMQNNVIAHRSLVNAGCAGRSKLGN